MIHENNTKQKYPVHCPFYLMNFRENDDHRGQKAAMNKENKRDKIILRLQLVVGED